MARVGCGVRREGEGARAKTRVRVRVYVQISKLEYDLTFVDNLASRASCARVTPSGYDGDYSFM